MIVTLIGKNVLYKTKLPKVAIGNYWITDENDKKLINIEGNGKYWRVVNSNNVKILNPKSINSLDVSKVAQISQNLIGEIVLREYSMNYIYLKDYSDNLFILYCAPVYEKNFTQLNIKNSQEILIGSGQECHIIYNNPLVKRKQARIFISNGKLMLESFDSDFGTFINNNCANKKTKMLFNGDVIFILGLKIIIIGRKIYINNPYRRVSYSSYIFEQNEKNVTIQKIEDDNDDSNIELYSEKDYFARAPRITNIIEREKIKIDPPPQSEKKDSMPLLYVLGSSLSMGIIMVISMMSTMDRLNSGNATVKNTIFSITTSVIMLISMLLIPTLSRRWEKRQRIKNEEKRQKRYREYIDSKIELIDDIMKKQKDILYENYISAEQCADMIVNNGSRLWERKIDEEDFLTVRIGTGDMPLEADIEYPKTEFTMEDDNLVEILNSIVNKSKIIKNVPITVSLLDKHIGGLIVNDNDRLVEKFTQNLIMQLIALHSYQDLKLVFLLKEDKNKKWEHLKTLPHIWDDAKEIRFWAEDYDEMKEVSRYLEEEFSKRLEYRNHDYKLFMPYYLIITDDYKKIENLRIINQIIEAKSNFGFGIFCTANNILELPNGCKIFITLENEKGIMFENEISSKSKKEFVFDSSYTFFFEKIGKQLFNIPIKYSTAKTALPDSYTFLEMYDAGRIEQLNIAERWRINDSTKSLQAPVGIDSVGLPIVLDIHEKFHGPHGLIAGSTGSGKSEFIKTYILSLALNYHPNDVTIIIIDYKGGDVAGAFQKREVKLPHLVGTITNIDTVGLQRSLASIQSELRRRQILFSQARNKVDEGTLDIYKYQKLYHEGVLKEPVPHLLIICDEFAELKQQQPEFMDELISVARIGRSLGVHLVLATQKPAGIVNDQIRSNSKFGVCLKVQDRQDSMDVIRKPHAAELKKTGQFYLQVGNDEFFTLGLVAWAGATYNPSDIIKKNVDNSIKFVSNIGSVIKEVGKPKKQFVRSKAEQLTSIVKYMYEIAKLENIQTKPLWLENIPEIIYIDIIKKKYRFKKKEDVITTVIGEFDDPYNQRQGLVELNLSTQGNIIIYGNAESGKETLLSTIVYDVMVAYSPKKVQMYIMDFGSEALKIFKDSPSVGDVVFAYQTEKINRLFEMLQREIRERTAILSDYNGDYDLYIKTSGKIMPMLIIMINNYEVFSENYENIYDDTLLTLTREGAKCGIVFVVTASSYNSLRYRLSQNFKQKLVLQLNNKDDYVNIFDKVGKKRPANIFGRGLVQMEDIYEFQTARICEPGKWNSYIKEVINNLKKNNKIEAKPIPVLPDVVTMEAIKDNLKDLTSVPIGINKKTLDVFTYNFKRDLVNIVSSKNIDIAAQFISHIIEAMKQLENVEVVLLDVEGILETGKTNINYKNFIMGMSKNVKTDKNIICVIIGIDKFINDIENGEKRFFEILQVAQLLKKYNFIIVENFNKLKSHQYEEWYKQYITGDTGIWIGNGVNDQYLISVNFNDKSSVNKCGESFGHVIRRDKVTLIKLLGMKEKGDEDE